MDSLLLQLFLTLSCLFCLTQSTSSPDYDVLLQSLHDKIDSAFRAESDHYKVMRVQAGALFTYSLADETSTDQLKVSEVSKSSLPEWLIYHAHNHKLVGVPTKQDIGTYKIEIENQNAEDLQDRHKYIKIEVYEPKDPFQCKNQPMTTGHVVLHSDIRNFAGSHRIKLMRTIAEMLDVSIHHIRMQEGNGMEMDTLSGSSIAMAGPGDDIKGRMPGIRFMWKVKCSTDIAGDRSIAMIKSHSSSASFRNVIGIPMVNWFVLMRHGRNRRAVGRLNGTPAGTPVVRPTVVTALPTPTPSIITKSTRVVTPEPTSAIVTTTTKPPTTMPTAPPTEPPTKGPTKPPVVTDSNRPPVKYNSIDRLDTQVFQPVEYFVPSNLFHDPDGDALTLSLKMADKMDNMVEVPASYFVQYHTEKNAIYILPESDKVGEHQFYLEASDGSQTVNEAFIVLVAKPNRRFPTSFNVTLDMDYNIVKNSVVERVVLAQKIEHATEQKDYRRLRMLQYREGSVIVEWALHDRNFTCNSIDYITYREHLTGDDFKRKMAEQDLDVVQTGVVSQCPAFVDPPREPASSDESWWERIMIPVIVIVIILLIIALILCCLYRRRRKYVPRDDEKNAQLLNQKKPVIFLEEYDEKPDFVSLQPLVLPNEKPPVAMEPRSGSPDGPDSSTISTESDEKAPMVPSSPKDSRHGYNAPPPYSAH